MKIYAIYLKDKQIFKKDSGTIRLVGNAVDVIKMLYKRRVKLIHINDEDLNNKNTTNFDVYNNLTYFINIQVEADDEKIIQKLIEVRARIVIKLPTKINLKRFEKDKNLLVGVVNTKFEGDVSQVNDLIIENADYETVKKYHELGKRIIVHKKDLTKEMKDIVFGVIEEYT